VTGTDLTQIDGIDVVTAQTILADTGADMSAWRTEKHFVFWLGLCPDHRISGGKVLKRGTRKVVSRAATAFRLAASTLRRSQSALGAKYRRLQSRLGPAKAITAMATSSGASVLPHGQIRLAVRRPRHGGIRREVQRAAVEMAFQEGSRTAVPLNPHGSSDRLKFLESKGQSRSCSRQGY
jgi:hypothetical protein